MYEGNSIYRAIGGVFASSLLALSLSGCIEDANLIQYAKWQQQEVYPEPQVRISSTAYIVSFDAGSTRLSKAERAQLEDFIASSGLTRGRQAEIQTATADSTGAVRLARLSAAVRQELAKYGIHATTRPPVSDGSQTIDQVAVFADHVVAAIPACPGYNAPVVQNKELGLTPELRMNCSNAANLGLMVADPRDLAVGKTLGPANGEQASNGVENYRTGKTSVTDVSKTISTSSVGTQ